MRIGGASAAFEKIEERIAARRARLRALAEVELGFEKAVRLAAFGSAVLDVVPQGIDARRAHVGILVEIELRVEQAAAPLAFLFAAERPRQAAGLDGGNAGRGRRRRERRQAGEAAPHLGAGGAQQAEIEQVQAQHLAIDGTADGIAETPAARGDGTLQAAGDIGRGLVETEPRKDGAQAMAAGGKALRVEVDYAEEDDFAHALERAGQIL